MNSQLEKLGQHGRRDSVRIAGIPVSDNDDTDSAILNICSAIKVDPHQNSGLLCKNWLTILIHCWVLMYHDYWTKYSTKNTDPHRTPLSPQPMPLECIMD